MPVTPPRRRQIRGRYAGPLVLVLAAFSGMAVPLPTYGAANTPAPPVAIEGQQGPTAVGLKVNPHLLAPLTGAVRGQSLTIPERHPDEAAFANLKAQANNQATPPPKASGAQPQTPPPQPSAEFPTLDYNAAGRVFNPPDGGLAVGPNSLLVAVNESFALYGRTGTRLLGPVTFQSFFGTTKDTFDPRALYDAGNAAAGGKGGGKGRFVLVTITHDNVARTASFRVAVSQNDNPASASMGWCTYALNALTGSGTWPDFTTLGMDGNSLYIGANQYSFDPNSFFGGTFQGARMLVIPKASVYPDTTSGSCPSATSTDFQNLKDPDGTNAFTIQPASQPDALPTSGATTMYFVDAVFPSGSRLALRSITTNAGQSVLAAPTGVNVPAYDLPAFYPQPGGSSISANDSRLRDAYDRYGTIYTTLGTQHVAGNPNANANDNVYWYEINASASTAVSHAITDPNVAYYAPGIVPGCQSAVSPCPAPFVALEFSGSSATQPASAYYQLGGGPPTRYQQGVSGYTLTGAWGDYPGAAPDPVNPTAVWLLGEYAAQTSAWGTAVTSLNGAQLGPTGLLRVVSSPALATQVLVDGQIADSWGLNWLKEPAGAHTVCFAHVEGWTEPPCQTVTVNANATTAVTGSFTQRGLLRVVTSPAVPSQISVDGNPTDDWGVWTDIPTGPHTVCFGPVAGFNPPACQNLNVSAGSQTMVTGTFTTNPSALGLSGVGLLRVVTSPAASSQVSIKPSSGSPYIADSWGLNWLELAPGSYTISFSHVQGYTEPASQTVTVTAGATTTVTGSLTQRGFLRVITSPAAAGTIWVDGIPRNDWGMWTDIATGSHTVCFGQAAGFASNPGCQIATVSAGVETDVTGTYS